MKILIIISMMIMGFSELKAQQKELAMNVENNDEVACELTTPELQKRKATVIAELKNLTNGKEELANGYRYKFPATDEVLDKLNLFIKTERLCCSFFTFQLTVDANNTVMDITGSTKAKEFLMLELDL